MDHRTDPAPRESIDEVIRGLRELRSASGSPSFAQIAQRITERRISQGTPGPAARVARTTVYDAFRIGRTRLDSTLVGEIAAALEEDEQLGAAWARRAQRARPRHEPGPQQGRQAPQGDESPQSVAPAEAPEAGDSEAALSPASVPSGGTSSTASDPDPQASPVPAASARPQHAAPQQRDPEVPRRWVVPIMVLCLAVNLLGYAAVGRLPLPLYLDMVGTAMAAMMLGPWRAVVVAVLTHALGMFVGPETSLALMPVNIAGALAWGYGARYWGMTRTPARFLVLSLGTALLCTAVAVPLLAIFFDAHTGHTTDGLVADFQARGLAPVVAALSGNLFTSVADKLISGAIALAAVSLLPASRSGPPTSAEQPQHRAPQAEYARQAEGYER